jgi:DNA-binding CsgD family transcriptional regulator
VKRIENENEILRLELEKVSMELKFKENELVSKALNLASKNDCFIMLEEKFNHIKTLAGQDLNQEINQILLAMRNNISVDKEWSNFQEKFNMINQLFINNLSSVCPVLSKTEIIICSMLRLQIDPKDIARIKFVSLSNIQNHILRIRKKMDLKRNISLMKYLIEL